MTKRTSAVRRRIDPSGTPPPIERDENGQTYDETADPLHKAGQAALKWYRDANANRPPVPQYVANGASIGRLHPMGPGNIGHGEFEARLCQVLGTRTLNFAQSVVTQLLNGPGLGGADITDKDRVTATNDGLSFIAAGDPTNEIETLVLLGIWQVQRASALQLRLMTKTEGLPQFEAHGGMAVKLGSLQLRHIDALARLRAAGKQIIEVQHVHVYQGGNAIVGSVHTGGVNPRSVTQSHAPALTNASGLAMWSEDPERETVPGAGDDGKGQVSDARSRRSPGGQSERGVSTRASMQGSDRDAPRPRNGEPDVS